MNVLVTGGTGFVGSHLIEALRAAGHEIRALVRPTSDRQLIRRLGAEAIDGDLDDPATIHDACRGCEVVFHAAARVDVFSSYSALYSTTVAGTEALVRAAMHAGVRRFVQISSCGVHHPDQMRDGAVINEDTPVQIPPRWFGYGRAKLAAEEIVRSRIMPPVEWVILRLGYLYGPRNRAMKQFLYPLLSGRWMKFIGRGDNEMALTHVRDAVDAIVAAGRAPRAPGRILIAASNERVTQRDYFNGLTDGFGLPRVRRSMPYRLAYSLAWIVEQLPMTILGGTFQRASVALTGLPQRINCDATQQLLNWKPRIAFADGIREACEWYTRENDLPTPAPAAA